MVTAAKSLWDNTLVRGLVILSAIGFAPFYFLSLAVASIR